MEDRLSLALTFFEDFVLSGFTIFKTIISWYLLQGSSFQSSTQYTPQFCTGMDEVDLQYAYIQNDSRIIHIIMHTAVWLMWGSLVLTSMLAFKDFKTPQCPANMYMRGHICRTLQYFKILACKH